MNHRKVLKARHHTAAPTPCKRCSSQVCYGQVGYGQVGYGQEVSFPST